MRNHVTDGLVEFLLDHTNGEFANFYYNAPEYEIDEFKKELLNTVQSLLIKASSTDWDQVERYYADKRNSEQ